MEGCPITFISHKGEKKNDDDGRCTEEKPASARFIES